MKYLIYILFTTSLLTISCTKNFTIDLDEIDNRMILYSIFNKDSIFKVKIIEEASLSDNVIGKEDFTKINNATVFIYKNNTIIDTVTNIGDGNYRGHVKPELSQNYTIVAKADGYDNIEANNKIPTPVKIESISKKEYSDETTGYNYTVKITFNDPKGERNYYMVYINLSLKSNWFLYDYAINDPAIGEWHSWMAQKPVFNDDLFDGEKYAITIKLQYKRLNDDDPDLKYPKFDLLSISEDYYKYVLSYNKQMPKYGDDMLELFQRGLIEPLPIYSNINGGLGLFAGQYISRDSIYFE